MPEQAFYMVGTIDDVDREGQEAGGVTLMADALQLRVVTPARALARRRVARSPRPARCGEFGVLPDHAALVTTLDAGELSYKQDGRTGESSRSAPGSPRCVTTWSPCSAESAEAAS